MASRSRGRVPSGNLRIAPVNRRGSAWNRSRLTWRCVTPHRRPVGSGAARGAAGSAAGRGIPAASGRARAPPRDGGGRCPAGRGPPRRRGGRAPVPGKPRGRGGAGPPAPARRQSHRPGVQRPVRVRRRPPVTGLTAGLSPRRTRPCAGRLRHPGCAASGRTVAPSGGASRTVRPHFRMRASRAALSACPGSGSGLT